MTQTQVDTEWKEWQEIAQRVNQVSNDVAHLIEVLNSVPESEWHDEQRKASEGLSELKDVLEERCYNEHPEKHGDDVTDLFYGEPNEATWE